MKAVVDCQKCRNKIFQEYRKEFLKEQYSIYTGMSNTFGKFATAALIMAQIRRGRSKKYIQQLFDELVMIYDSPSLFGKEVRSDEMIKRLEKEYDLDFSRIKFHIQSESEFLKECK